MNGFITRFLLTVQGVNDAIVFDSRMPRDAVHREITVAMGMLVTASFAFVASLAALLMIFEEQPWRWAAALPLALLWAVAIFTIDRALVLSMTRARWPAIVARLLLGMLVAVSISMPIDIALFKDRIQIELLKKSHNEQLVARDKIAQIHDLVAVNGAAERALAELEQAKSAADQMPQEIVGLRGGVRECQAELDRQRQTLEPQIAELNAQLVAIAARKAAAAQSTPRDADQMQNLQAQQTQLQPRRNALSAELKVAVARCERLRQEAQSAERQYRQEARDRVAQAAEQAKTTRSSAEHAADQAQQDADKAGKIIQQSLSDSFVAKAEALHRLVWSEPSSAVTYFLILTLWITLEMSAILAKIMAGRSCIDRLLEAKGEHVIFEETVELTRRQQALRTEVELEEVTRTKAAELAQKDPSFAQDKLRRELAARTVLATHRELQREMESFMDESERLRQRAAKGYGARVSNGANTQMDIRHVLHELDRAAAEAIVRALNGSDRASADVKAGAN